MRKNVKTARYNDSKEPIPDPELGEGSIINDVPIQHKLEENYTVNGAMTICPWFSTLLKSAIKVLLINVFIILIVRVSINIM